MPGKKITKQQVEIYMSNKTRGLTQKIAAAKAGLSEKRGYRCEHGQLANQDKERKRLWKGKKNPFEGVWESVIVPLLIKGIYQNQNCQLVKPLMIVPV